MMNTQSYYRAVDFLAQIIAGYRVQICFDSGMTATNGEVIYIGKIAPDCRWFFDALKGYVAHEAFHCRYTEFNSKYRSKGEFVFSLTNGIEDTRIERKGLAEYPGMKEPLDNVVRLCVELGMFPELEDAKNTPWLFSGYVLYRLRGAALGQPNMTEMADRGRAAVESVIGQDATDRLDAILSSAHPESTRESFNIAIAIAELLKGAMDNQSGDESDGEDSGAGELGESGEGGAEGDKNESDERSTVEHPDGNAEDGDAADESGDSAGRSGGDKPSKELDEAGEADCIGDLGKILEGALNDAAKEAESNGTAESSSVMCSGDLMVKDMVASGRAQDKLSEGALNELRTLLRTQLVATQRTRRTPATRGSRIMGRRVARAYMGQSDIFRQETRKKELNASIGILVDGSSSMSGKRAEIASSSAYALCGALENLTGVKTTVAVFGGVRSWVRVMKTEKQSLIACSGKFAPVAEGYTPTGESLMWMIRQLANSKQERKMLVLATDGEENGAVKAKDAFALADKLGIQVVCLGIQYTIGEVYPNRLRVDSLEDLPKALFNSVHGFLLGAA